MSECTHPASDILVARDLTKVYGQGSASVVALDKVSVTLKRGELVLLTGASGSGKTTLLNILGCLDHATAGTLLFNGMDTSTLSRDQLAELRSRRIGFVFQQFNLLPRLTALENVLLPLIIVGERARPDLGISLLEMMDLASRAHHRPAELSGGEQQRVAIARALIRDPDLVLADEPTGNLDSRTGERILTRLCELVDIHRTVLIVTHRPEVIQASSRVLRLSDGCLVGD